jgi:hypothetical protein
MSLKNPMTTPGIDPGTVRGVAQRLNHYVTPGPQRKGGRLFKNHPNICLVILRKITHTRGQIGDFRAETLTRDLCIRSMTATTGSRPTVERVEFFYNHGPTRPPVVDVRRHYNANYRYYANAFCGKSTRTQIHIKP